MPNLDLTTPSQVSHSALVSLVSSFNFSSLSREKLLEVRQILSSGTTRVCPECLNTRLLELRSMSKKICPDCGMEIEWNLEKGQRPLV